MGNFLELQKGKQVNHIFSEKGDVKKLKVFLHPLFGGRKKCLKVSFPHRRLCPTAYVYTPRVRKESSKGR